MSKQNKVLLVIIVSQFFCTSLWFAGNGVMNNLILDFNLSNKALGYLTSSVQLGFISGTFIFALFTLVDRFSPSKVFCLSALLGALVNLIMIWEQNTFYSLMAIRFSTGFFLAGIYPVGMKIAADYYDKKLGKSLGYLVGALVLGTALPHLLKNVSSTLDWRYVIYGTSLLAGLGGVLVAVLIKDGPYRKRSQKFDLSVITSVFKNQKLRSAAFGYFGHMWELYAFWTLVPVMLKTYMNLHRISADNIAVLSFSIIAVGFISCTLGGQLSLKYGAKKVAFSSLLLSGICCLLLPLLIQVNFDVLFYGFLIFWGMVVISDSPMFSTLVAQNADTEIKGTSLTIVNCIGFAITIISIQLLSFLLQLHPTYSFAILAIGPIFGLRALRKV